MSLYEIGKWPVSRDDPQADEQACGRLGTPKETSPGTAGTVFSRALSDLSRRSPNA